MLGGPPFSKPVVPVGSEGQGITTLSVEDLPARLDEPVHFGNDEAKRQAERLKCVLAGRTFALTREAL